VKGLILEQSVNESGATLPVPVRSRPTLDEEAQLVRELKARDSRAWASLFDVQYELVCRYAYARLGSRTDAEDVASQVFLRALEAVHGYEYRGRPILAWLYTIARNLVNERYRKAGRHSVALDDADLAHPGPDLAERIDLVNAIRNLKEGQREVVVLRFSLGLSLRETAAILGRTEASVHSLQVRAVKNLRDRLSS
jgi:RNA polymerase sigma-70 factor (ECF subfamily)